MSTYTLWNQNLSQLRLNINLFRQDIHWLSIAIASVCTRDEARLAELPVQPNSQKLSSREGLMDLMTSNFSFFQFNYFQLAEWFVVSIRLDSTEPFIEPPLQNKTAKNNQWCIGLWWRSNVHSLLPYLYWSFPINAWYRAANVRVRV